MRWLDVDTENCSVRAALDVVGAKWSLLIVRELFNGVHRFDEIREHMGISEAVLARRLSELQDAQLVESIEYRDPGQRTRRKYRLTESGLDLFPILIAMLQWGDRHRTADGTGSWQVQHRECGRQVTAVVACPDHPDRTLDHRDTITSAGPTATPVLRPAI
ncbi:helix-turn-helix domain-containing protein [Rhodococcus sp. SORGH_AS_0301]|uniref:winged helix-turn-helix transcriptional regulator n=1 Tax=Rhodococcus sp. SORGH_AS_0301 TaxID=3041780 RepID=UPI0027811392|nr:helix-turn-helix domain-containing protein [Rhodococcus sp. SORGH_AS_0301]MDQ1181816.1 DNA-binding HxlR family transcriptional regulator [Rhodococcus sp. SORGH_AS_0301]